MKVLMSGIWLEVAVYVKNELSCDKWKRVLGMKRNMKMGKRGEGDARGRSVWRRERREYPMIIWRLRVWLGRYKGRRTGAMMGPRGTTWHAHARELRCVPHVTPLSLSPTLPFMDAPSSPTLITIFLFQNFHTNQFF